MNRIIKLLEGLNARFSDGAPVFTLRNHSVEAQVGNIRLQSAFQPIVRANSQQEQGWEGLVRPFLPDGTALPPPVFFDYFAVGQEMARIDRICRCLHLANFVLANGNGHLFLNLHPRHLLSVEGTFGAAFSEVAALAGIPTERIVLEVLEHCTDDEKRLARAILEFKSHGFLIALDDFGQNSDTHTVDRLFQLKPHIVKFDQSLLHINNPIVLPRLVRAVRELGALSVMEGIETADEASRAYLAGANLLQGFHLGRPQSKPKYIISADAKETA